MITYEFQKLLTLPYVYDNNRLYTLLHSVNFIIQKLFPIQYYDTRKFELTTLNNILEIIKIIKSSSIITRDGSTNTVYIQIVYMDFYHLCEELESLYDLDMQLSSTSNITINDLSRIREVLNYTVAVDELLHTRYSSTITNRIWDLCVELQNNLQIIL